MSVVILSMLLIITFSGFAFGSDKPIVESQEINTCPLTPNGKYVLSKYIKNENGVNNQGIPALPGTHWIGLHHQR
jgi:hypothetical protein